MRTAKLSKRQAIPLPIPSGCETFRTETGDAFTVALGSIPQHRADILGEWAIMFDGQRAGTLYTTAAHGAARWHASTRDLFWLYANDAPVGIGFDVWGIESAKECLRAYSRSAAEILAWNRGQPVPSMYSKTGTFQKVSS